MTEGLRQMFPTARDRNTVRANEESPFPDPHPLINVEPVQEK